MRKEQLVAVGIIDLDRVVPPPALPAGNAALSELPAKIGQPLGGQLDEQPSPVASFRILTENDLALSAVDLAHGSCAVVGMPALLEAEHVDVEANRAVHVGDEE